MRRLRGESGQASLLLIGMLLVAFAVTGVAVDIARSSLLRRTLQSAADSAASVGASQLDRGRYYASGGTDRFLEPGAARTRALVALRARPDISPLAVTATNGEVRVSVAGHVRTSLLRVIGIRRLTVTAHAVAEPVFGEG